MGTVASTHPEEWNDEGAEEGILLSDKGAATMALIEREGQVLLVATHWPGAGVWWQLPGGSVLAGQSLAEALRRQLAEEAGLDAAVDDLLYVMEIEDHLIFTFQARLSGADPTKSAKVDCCFVPIEQLGAFPRLIGREPLLEWLTGRAGRKRYYRLMNGPEWF